MKCYQCEEKLSLRILLAGSFNGGWRCRACEAMFYVDTGSLRKRSLLVAGGLLALGVFLPPSTVASASDRVFFAYLLGLCFVCSVFAVLTLTYTKTTSVRGDMKKRRHQYAACASIFLVAYCVPYVFADFWGLDDGFTTMLVMIPGMALALFFFTRGWNPS